MITANDVWKLMKNQPEIDNFISEYVVPKFVNGQTMTISVPEEVVNRHKWGRDPFISAMGMRGFSVEFKCDDRPCGHCRYIITIPPQGE